MKRIKAAVRQGLFGLALGVTFLATLALGPGLQFQQAVGQAFDVSGSLSWDSGTLVGTDNDTNTHITDTHQFFVRNFTGDSTVYVVPGCISATKGLCAVSFANDVRIDNSHCRYVNGSGAALDPGAGDNVIITLETGTCGSESSSSHTCTLAGGGTSPCDGTTEVTVTGGNCLVFAITDTTDAADGNLICTYEQTRAA